MAPIFRESRTSLVVENVQNLMDDLSKNDNQNEKIADGKKFGWKSLLFTIVYSLTVFGTSFSSSCLGQSVQIFSKTTNSSISAIGNAFTSRTIGMLCAGIISAGLCSYSEKIHQKKSTNRIIKFLFSAPVFLIISIFVNVVSSFVIPFVTTSYAVIFLKFLIGYGYLSSYVISNWMISKFAEENVKTIYLQFPSVANGIGNFLAPLFIGFILDLNLSARSQLLIIYLSAGNLCLLFSLVCFFFMDYTFIYQGKKEEEQERSSEIEMETVGNVIRPSQPVKMKKSSLNQFITNLYIAILGAFVGISFGSVASCFLDTGYTYLMKKEYLSAFNASLFITTFSAAGVVSRIVVLLMNLKNPFFQLKTTGMFIVCQVVSMICILLFVVFSFFFIDISILWIIVGILGFFFFPQLGFLLTCLVEMQFELGASQVSFILSGISLGFSSPTIVLYLMEIFGDKLFIYSLIAIGSISCVCVCLYFISILLIKGRKVVFKNAFLSISTDLSNG